MKKIIYLLMVVSFATVSFLLISDLVFAQETKSLLMKTYFAPPSQKFINLQVQDFGIKPQPDKTGEECSEGSIYVNSDDNNKMYTCKSFRGYLEWTTISNNVWSQEVDSLDGVNYLQTYFSESDEAEVPATSMGTKIGIGTNTPRFNLSLGGVNTRNALTSDGGILAFGEMGNVNSEMLTIYGDESSASRRMVWYPYKAAFYAGIGFLRTGNYSSTFGYSSDAPGEGAFAAGWDAYAGGKYSFAVGYSPEAYNPGSISLGHTARARHDNDIVLGRRNIEDALYDSFFEIGNGNLGFSDAFEILKSGDVRFGLNEQSDLNIATPITSLDASIYVLGNEGMVVGGSSPSFVFNIDASGVDDMQIKQSAGKLNIQSIAGGFASSGVLTTEDILTITDNRVGIKQSTPAYTLDIAGDMSGDDYIVADGYVQTEAQSAPVTCGSGEIYYNSSNVLYGCVGGTWKSFALAP